MLISVNKIEEEFKGENLYDLAVEKGLIERPGIAIAVNEKVITRKEWQFFNISENDEIILITPACGG